MKKAENLCRIVRNEKGCGTGYCSAPSWIKELNYEEVSIPLIDKPIIKEKKAQVNNKLPNCIKNCKMGLTFTE